ncbi:18491_t:CDS:2 [Rhizophagus irregularis]|nr:18491_t:CDS:2 [Rhizophagus irregularis]
MGYNNELIINEDFDTSYNDSTQPFTGSLAGQKCASYPSSYYAIFDADIIQLLCGHIERLKFYRDGSLRKYNKESNTTTCISFGWAKDQSTPPLTVLLSK